MGARSRDMELVIGGTLAVAKQGGLLFGKKLILKPGVHRQEGPVVALLRGVKLVLRMRAAHFNHRAAVGEAGNQPQHHW